MFPRANRGSSPKRQRDAQLGSSVGWPRQGTAQLSTGGHWGPHRTCSLRQQYRNNLLHRGWCPLQGLGMPVHPCLPDSQRKRGVSDWERAKLCQDAPPVRARQGGFHTAQHYGPNSFPLSGSCSAWSFKARLQLPFSFAA